MNGRFFLDTNILVYNFDGRAPAKQKRARQLVAEALAGRDGIISYQVVQEFLNVALRKFDQPMTPSEAQLYLAKVLLPLCEVFPDSSLYSQGLSIVEETGFNFYDALIVASAAIGRCPVLWSEGLQHGRVVRAVEIRNPFL